MNKVPKLVWVILGILLLLNLVSIGVALRSPSGKSYPSTQVVKGPVGDIGPVGPAGPQGQAGISLQGSLGPQGVQGQPGISVTPDQIASAVADYLQANPPAQGPQGDQGQSGREVELRTDPNNGDLEWRYVGSLQWLLLTKSCQLTNTCQ